MLGSILGCTEGENLGNESGFEIFPFMTPCY